MKERILNLTQHKATVDQINAGVIELSNNHKSTVCELLTFDYDQANDLDYKKRAAKKLAEIAAEYDVDKVMIGGAPFFMYFLSRALTEKLISAVFAFSERRSEEFVNDKGEVIKQSAFVHKGFIDG